MSNEESIPPTQLDEATAAKVLAQIEFYFSDSNLPYDSFLFNLACERLPNAKAPLGTGWVPLETIISFNRMRSYGDLPREAVGEVLRQSSFIKVSPDATTIRRTTELKPGGEEALDRSTYVKGFPSWPADDAQRKKNEDDLQPRLEAYFQQFGPTRAVRMRRETPAANEKTKPGNRRFKGSVFVEWLSKQAAEDFAAKTDLPRFEDFEEDVTTMLKRDYMTMKAKEKGLPFPGTEKGSSTGGAGSRGFNAFKVWKDYEKKRAQGKLRETAKQRAAASGPGGKSEDGTKSLIYENVTFKVNKEAQIILEEGQSLVGTSDNSLLLPQRTLAFSNAGLDPGVKRFLHLKEKLNEVQPTAFVDIQDDATSGIVSFHEPVTDEKFEAIKAKNIQLGGTSLTWSRPTLEEEETFHKARISFHANRAFNPPGRQGGKKQGGRGGRDNRGNNNKRKHEDGNANGAEAKKVKSDDA